MLSFLLVIGLSLQVNQFDQHVVWRPPQGFRDKVLAACSKSGTGFGPCFVGEMKTAGASPEAIEFTHLIDNNGYVEALRPTGHIDAALISYPFRANENSGLFLINGKPPAVNIDDFKNLPQAEMKHDGAYADLLKAYTDPSLWPGDRSSPDALLALRLPDGSQQFIADYRIQAGCHACAVLGQAFFSFHFDPHGNFKGATFNGFTPKYVFSRVASTQMLSVKPRSTWTILLPSNRTTGYSWKLTALSAESSVRNIAHRYVPAGTSQFGTAGEEEWTFQAAGKGESELDFAYARPWEKNNPARTVSIHVSVP